MLYPTLPQIDDTNLRGRKEAGRLPRSYFGLVLAVLYLILASIQFVDDFRCRRLLCGIESIILTAPTSFIFAFVLGQRGILIALLINTLVVYLIGSGLGRAIRSLEHSE